MGYIKMISYITSLSFSFAGPSMLIFVNVAGVVLVISIIIAALVLTQHSDS